MKNRVERKYLKTSPLILFLFCFFMYTPSLKAFPLLLTIVSYGIPFLYILINRSVFNKIGLRQSKTILFAVFLLLLSLLSIALHETGDYSHLIVSSYFFRKAIIYMFLLCVILKKTEKEKAAYYFMYYFALTHVVHVICTLLFVLIPSIQETWFSIFVKEVSSESLLNSYGYTFRLGWQGFAGFRLTLYCTISIIFTLFLRYGSNEKPISAIQFLVLFLGCILGNMFYGRSGVIVSSIVTIAAILYWNRKNIKRIILFCSLPIIIVVSLNTLKDVPVFSDWYRWMSTPIINLLSTGDANNASFDRLQEMSQIEIPESTIMFGDGYYKKDGHYYMQTDVGYLRNILFWGVFGFILSYLFTAYSLFSLKKMSKLMIIQLMIVFLIFEYKGAVYYEFPPIIFALSIAMNYLPENSLAKIDGESK